MSGGGAGGEISVGAEALSATAVDEAFFFARALGFAGAGEAEDGVSAWAEGASEGGAAFLGRGMG